MLLLDFGKGFRDEIVATASVLGITVIGSFFVVNQMMADSTANRVTSTPQVLGSQNVSAPTTPTQVKPTPAPTNSQVSPAVFPTATQLASTSATPNASIQQTAYGSNQNYDNSDYKLNFSQPTMYQGTGRIFKVKVVLANKSVTTGLKNTLTAEITREGKVIIADAPMNVSEIKTVYPGEQITFIASLSVIEGTEISQITYDPGGNTVATHYTISRGISN